MRALVYNGLGKFALQERPVPTLQGPGDAIVKMSKTTICGTDLHILKGDVPTCEPGRILGHEGVGVVHEIGSGVSTLKVGDHVLVSCISSCGQCEYCRRGMYSHCKTGGWILGNRIDGTQAEYVRTPHAQTSLYRVPAGVDEAALVMLSDILPTGFECGVLNGKVEPGSTVAIVGAGPIGLAALLTAQFYSPSQIIMIDMDPNRLACAKRFGATACLDPRAGDVADALRTVWAWTARSRPLACQRRSSFASNSWLPAGSLLTWECTAYRHQFSSTSSGIVTSRSPRGSSTRSARQCCSRQCAPAASIPGD